jgi:hypothetical protein
MINKPKKLISIENEDKYSFSDSSSSIGDHSPPLRSFANKKPLQHYSKSSIDDDSSSSSSDFDNMKYKNDVDLVIHSTTEYWFYMVTEDTWDQITNNFSKNKYILSSYYEEKVSKNDIILIYKKHSPLKTGFVCICQASSNMKINSENTRIFKDKNMNKFCFVASSITQFNQIYRLTQIDTKLKTSYKDFKIESFRKNYIKNQTTFIKIISSLGRALVEVLIHLSDTEKPQDIVSTKSKSESDESDDTDDTDESDESDDTDSESESESESESDDVLITTGHIPILMIPCPDFEWQKDNNKITIDNFKKHYKSCDKCDKTDNNNCAIYPYLIDKNAKIICEEITDYDDIELYANHYWNLENYKFELEGDEKKHNHVHIFRINSRDHMYHKCIMIVW